MVSQKKKYPKYRRCSKTDRERLSTQIIDNKRKKQIEKIKQKEIEDAQ